MKTKRPFIYPGYVGTILIVLGLFLMSIFPKHVPYMADGFQTPIIYFEFVQTIEEAQQLFGMTNGLLPDDNLIQQMNFGNKIDFIYAFIYSLFLFLFARKLVEISGKKFFTAVMILAVIAFIFDCLENIKLIIITENLASGSFQTDLETLFVFTWIKWGGLALSFVILSEWFFRGKIISTVFAFLGWVPMILGILAYKMPGFYNELFAKSIMFMFIALIVYSFIYRIPKAVEE
ncbi:MAG: hypothetical protein ABFS35_10640 [Bacteroidota bacterium]